LRYFSSTGYIVNKTRSSLDPNIVNMLVCLRDMVPLTLKFQVLTISITLNWMVIFLSLLNSTTWTYVIFF